MTPTRPNRANRANRRTNAAAGLPEQVLVVDGQARTYLLSAPPGGPRPTIIVLHGGGGQAAGMVGLLVRLVVSPRRS